MAMVDVSMAINDMNYRMRIAQLAPVQSRLDDLIRDVTASIGWYEGEITSAKIRETATEFGYERDMFAGESIMAGISITILQRHMEQLQRIKEKLSASLER